MKHNCLSVEQFDFRDNELYIYSNVSPDYSFVTFRFPLPTNNEGHLYSDLHPLGYS